MPEDTGFDMFDTPSVEEERVDEARKHEGEGYQFKGKTAFDPEKHGYGKHKYFTIDPDTINPEDYARSMRGEETHFGDVREYNSAENEKHPDNNVTLDDLSRIGTVIETEAKGFEGDWEVVALPEVHAPLNDLP